MKKLTLLLTLFLSLFIAAPSVGFAADYILSINDVSVGENSGTAQFTVSVNPAIQDGDVVTVDYDTMPGSAVTGSDFFAATGTLNFDNDGDKIDLGSDLSLFIGYYHDHRLPPYAFDSGDTMIGARPASAFTPGRRIFASLSAAVLLLALAGGAAAQEPAAVKADSTVADPGPLAVVGEFLGDLFDISAANASEMRVQSRRPPGPSASLPPCQPSSTCT